MFLGLLLFIASFIPVATIDRAAEVVSAADGVPIHYSVQGKGEPTLVFIHCWSCDRHLWDNQVAAFVKTIKSSPSICRVMANQGREERAGQ